MNGIKQLVSWLIISNNHKFMREVHSAWVKGERDLLLLQIRMFFRSLWAIWLTLVGVNIAFAATEYALFGHAFVHYGDYVLIAALICKLCADTLNIVRLRQYQGVAFMNA